MGGSPGRPTRRELVLPARAARPGSDPALRDIRPAGGFLAGWLAACGRAPVLALVMLLFCPLPRKMSEAPHPPGSRQLDALSSHVLNAFASYGLDHSWTDSHYVRLQSPDRSVRPEKAQVAGAGGGMRSVRLLTPSDSTGSTPTSCTGWVLTGSCWRNCPWRSQPSTAPTAPPDASR